MKLPKYLILNKKVGETPLEVLEQFKRENVEYAAVPMAYAGRLDPLASGKLLVLVGHECKNQEKYRNLDKEYEVEIAFGISSDSGDLLGLIDFDSSFNKDSEKFRFGKFSKFVGKHSWKYPPFSSKTVDGLPLFQYALQGRLDEIEIPSKDIEIFEMELLGEEYVDAETFVFNALKKVDSIKPVEQHQKALGNDFRRDEIRKRYRQMQGNAPREIVIMKIRCICSSGTYMRTLAEKIGEELGTKALAYSIYRTKIGTYKKFGPLKFWSKKY